jgi:hypothetical protein
MLRERRPLPPRLEVIAQTTRVEEVQWAVAEDPVGDVGLPDLDVACLAQLHRPPVCRVSSLVSLNRTGGGLGGR